MMNEAEIDEQKELLANFFYTRRLLASILGQWKLFVEENQEIEILSLQKSKKLYLQRNFNRFQFYSYHHLHYHQQQCKKSKLFHFILLQIKYFKRWIFHHQKYYRQHPFHSIKITNQRNRKLQNYLIRKNEIKCQELFLCWKDRVFSRISLFRRLRKSSSSLCLQVFQSLHNAVNQRKKQDRLRQQYFVIKKKLRKKQSFDKWRLFLQQKKNRLEINSYLLIYANQSIQKTFFTSWLRIHRQTKDSPINQISIPFHRKSMIKQYLMKLHAQSADREFDRMKIQKFDRIAKKSLSRRILKKWKEFHQEKKYQAQCQDQSRIHCFTLLKFFTLKHYFLEKWKQLFHIEIKTYQNSSLQLANSFYLYKSFQWFRHRLLFHYSKKIHRPEQQRQRMAQVFFMQTSLKKRFSQWLTFARYRGIVDYQRKIRSIFFYKLFRELKYWKILMNYVQERQKKRNLVRNAQIQAIKKMKRNTLYRIFHKLLDSDEENGDPVKDNHIKISKEHERTSTYQEQYLKYERYFQHHPTSLLSDRSHPLVVSPSIATRFSRGQLYQRKIFMKYYFNNWKSLIADQLEDKRRFHQQVQQDFLEKRRELSKLTAADPPQFLSNLNTLPLPDRPFISSFDSFDFISASLPSAHKAPVTSVSLTTADPLTIHQLAKAPPRRRLDHQSSPVSIPSLYQSISSPPPSAAVTQSHQFAKGQPRHLPSHQREERIHQQYSNFYSTFPPPFPSMTIAAAPNQSQSSIEERPQASATEEEERTGSLTEEEQELLRVFHEIHEMILKYPDKVKEQWKKHPEKQQLFQSLIPQIELLEKKLSQQQSIN